MESILLLQEKHLPNVLEYFKDVEGPFRTYVNPRRSDGVFVGQDKPYDQKEGPYPAVPQGAKHYPCQVPHEVANKAVQILNGRNK